MSLSSKIAASILSIFYLNNDEPERNDDFFQNIKKIVNNKIAESETVTNNGKKKKDPNKPKKPCTPYILFASDMRPQVVSQNPNMSPNEITQELGRLWREEYNTDDKRTLWIERSNDQKQKYQKEMVTYNCVKIKKCPEPKKILRVSLD